jgi:predicted regulator of Ras-like GTPase activity (Roadblock/LC7/MglB family)
MHNPNVDPHFASVCRTRLLDLADSCPGLLAASVSSKDGVVIASWGASEDNSKIGVIAGSFHAVSESVIEEANLESCRNIAIFMATPPANPSVLLVLITTRRAELAAGWTTVHGLLPTVAALCP